MTTALDRTAPAATAARSGRWITEWHPEDEAFWASTGRKIARRNIIFSILAEHFAFSVWLLWSVATVYLTVAAGFDFSVDQLFWLVALPNLVGSFLRIPYTAAVGRFGGRNWTTISATLLLIPIGLMTYCLTNPETPYWMFLVAAATAGFGGGNFASSMANISYFYPDGRKGLPLGLNAAGGNIGVAVVQLLVPLVIGVGIIGSAGVGDGLYLQNAPLLWALPVAVSALLAWLFMDNLAVSRASLSKQVACLANRHNWVMSFLYIGTFGSFIGYSAAFPLLIKTQFPELGLSYLAFLGPLVGSVSRPLGGWFSDRLGGARVTAWNFVAMGLGVIGILLALDRHSFPLFLGTFLFLFVTSGIGNGSTFRMIPSIYRAQALARAERDGTDPAPLLTQAKLTAAVVIGFSSALGAFGGFLIPRTFAMSISATGSIGTALSSFLGVYAVMVAVTWWYYLRRRLLAARAPGLAYANV